jgi:hypothetical protein
VAGVKEEKGHDVWQNEIDITTSIRCLKTGWNFHIKLPVCQNTKKQLTFNTFLVMPSMLLVDLYGLTKD